MKVFDRFARNRDFDELVSGLSSMFCSGKPVSEKALEDVLERILADIPDPWPCFEFLVALDSRAASTDVLFRRRGTMPPVGIRLALLARSPVPKSFLDVTPCDFLFLVHALNLPTTFSTPWDVVLDDGDGKSSNISKSIRRMESFWSPEGVNAVGDFETMPPERYLSAPVSFGLLKETLDWMDAFSSEHRVSGMFLKKKILLERLLEEIRFWNISSATVLDACILVSAAATGLFHPDEGGGVFDSGRCLERWMSLVSLLDSAPFAASHSHAGYEFLVFLKSRSFTGFDDMTPLFSMLPWIRNEKFEKPVSTNETAADAAAAERIFLSGVCEPLLERGYGNILKTAKTIDGLETERNTPWRKRASLICGAAPEGAGFWFDESVVQIDFDEGLLQKAFESEPAFPMSRTEAFLQHLHDEGKISLEQNEYGTLIADFVDGYFDWLAGGGTTDAKVEIPPSKRGDGDVATYFQAVSPFECEDFLVFLGGVESTAFGGYFLRALEIDCAEAMNGYMTKNARIAAERWLERRP